MFADLNIPSLSNDMKIAVQKNHLGGQIWYRSLDPLKNGVIDFFVFGRQFGTK